MPSTRHAVLAVVCAGTLGLLFTTPAMSGDRASDPVGDGPRPGLDIIAATTTVTDVAVTFEVDLAGDWVYEENSLLYLFIGKTQQDHCGGWFADYTVVLEADRITGSFAHAVGLAVDGPHVTLVIPLEVMRHPPMLWVQLMTRDPSIVADDELAGIDLFPDPAPDQDWGMSCREVAIVPDVRSPSASPARAPGPATTGSGAGPWLTVLPVTLLLAVAGLLLYDWLVAEHRWRRPASRK